MSTQAVRHAISQGDVTDPRARLVLLCLAVHAGRAQSVGDLSIATSLTARTVRAKLRMLRCKGLVTKYVDPVTGGTSWLSSPIREGAEVNA